MLALQGAFIEHVDALARLKQEELFEVEASLVRCPDDLSDLDGLIIPGGESSVMTRLASINGLMEAIKNFVHVQSKPVFGTCAGLILLSDRVESRDEPIIGGLDVTVKRNAYGRQLESFRTDRVLNTLDGSLGEGIFIRAPAIQSIHADAQVVASLDGLPVGVKDSNNKIIGLAFHPELTKDLSWHRQFIWMIKSRLA